jgi:hypothetical protein
VDRRAIAELDRLSKSFPPGMHTSSRSIPPTQWANPSAMCCYGGFGHPAGHPGNLHFLGDWRPMIHFIATRFRWSALSLS